MEKTTLLWNVDLFWVWIKDVRCKARRLFCNSRGREERENEEEDVKGDSRLFGM